MTLLSSVTWYLYRLVNGKGDMRAKQNSLSHMSKSDLLSLTRATFCLKRTGGNEGEWTRTADLLFVEKCKIILNLLPTAKNEPLVTMVS